MDLYAENVLDHYRHPRNKEALPHPTISHREENASCGDDLTVDLEIENGIIVAVGWNGNGCAISQAAMSLLSEEICGKSVKELARLEPNDVLQLLKVPVGPRRIKCALLSLEAVKNALNGAADQD